MLTDLGLQTPEQIAKYHEDMRRSFSIPSRGCVGQRICKNCNHLISDSICLCIGIFTCPNCGFENGAEIKAMIEKSRNSPNYGGVIFNVGAPNDPKVSKINASFHEGNKNLLILMCAPSNSGKTTFAKKLCEENPGFVRLNADELRGIVGQSESDQSVNYKVFEILYATTKLLLAQGFTILVDNTNYSRKNRKRFIEIAKKLNKKIVIYWLTTPIEECKKRNQLRDRKVPTEIIDRQFNNFAIPTEDECDFMWLVDSEGNIVIK